MSELTGEEVEVDGEISGLRHQPKMARKPAGGGIEAKCISDAETCIILRWEMVEGKQPMQAKPHMSEYRADTAYVLRLSEPWHGRGRYIIADGAFSSLPTVTVAARTETVLDRGLYAVGIVKTATTGDPMQVLRDGYESGEAARNAGYPAHEHGRRSWSMLRSDDASAGDAQRSVFALG